MKKLTFRRIRGIGSFEIDLEHLTVIAGDDDVAKEVLMTCMYAMVESMSDAHGDGDRASVLDDILKREFGCRKRILDGASMEAEDASIGVSDTIEVKGSLGITKTVLYDSPLVVRGLFTDDDNHRAELVLKRIDGLLGGVCNLRPQGADAIVECDGMKVEVNGDVVVSGITDIRHVVYIREPPVLGYDILGVTFPGLYEQLIREPVRGTDEEPDEYRRIMDVACPGDLVHEGGSFRFINPDGTVTEPCDMRPSSMILSVLKRLRSNGSLCEGSLLIIRNPEAHMHPSILRMLVELLVVMSGRLGVRVLVLTQELLVTIGSHILSCMHGTEIGYLLVSDDSIHACTSSALDGINKPATKEMDDLWWGEDA